MTSPDQRATEFWAGGRGQCSRCSSFGSLYHLGTSNGVSVVVGDLCPACLIETIRAEEQEQTISILDALRDLTVKVESYRRGRGMVGSDLILAQSKATAALAAWELSHPQEGTGQ